MDAHAQDGGRRRTGGVLGGLRGVERPPVLALGDQLAGELQVLFGRDLRQGGKPGRRRLGGPGRSRGRAHREPAQRALQLGVDLPRARVFRREPADLPRRLLVTEAALHLGEVHAHDLGSGVTGAEVGFQGGQQAPELAGGGFEPAGLAQLRGAPGGLHRISRVRGREARADQ